MAYIEGTGNLILGSPSMSNASGNRTKEISADSDDLLLGETLAHGNGLSWEDGEILSFPTELFLESMICHGTGVADNLYAIPKINLIAEFTVQPVIKEARFKIGRGN